MDASIKTGTSNQILLMSEPRYTNNSVRTIATVGEESRNNVVATSNVHSMSSSSLHSVCTISSSHISSDPLTISSLSSHPNYVLSTSTPQGNGLKNLTYEVVHHNGSTLNSHDTNNSSVLWVENKNSGVTLASLSTGLEMSSSRDTKLKNQPVHTPITSTLHNNALIHENQDTLLNVYHEILDTQDNVGDHGLPESSQAQLEGSMNPVENSQAHLITLPDDKNLNSGLLLSNANMSSTSYDKSILNMSNVYSVAPSHTPTSLRNHALTLDTSVHTLHAAVVRSNDYEQHSHTGQSNIGCTRDANGGGTSQLQVRGVTLMSNLDMSGGTSTHLQSNDDILMNESGSLHLPSLDLSANLMDQMNNLNHLSAQENSCENLKLDCLIETLPCYRCKVCPFFTLSKEAVEHHLRSVHSKLLNISPEDVQHQEAQGEKSQSISSNMQRPQEVNAILTDPNALSKDVTFICGMCDKLFPYIESCSAHMAVEHNIPADNVQLEPMNQTTLPVHNLISSATVLTQASDQHHHNQHQVLPSLLPSLRPKISLVTTTSSYISGGQESLSITTTAPTKKAIFSQKTKPASSVKQTKAIQPKLAPKSAKETKNQPAKQEIALKRPNTSQAINEALIDDSSNENEKKTEDANDVNVKNSKKRGRPRGSKGPKVVAAKKTTARGKADSQKDTRFRCEMSGCAIRMRSMDNMEYHLRSHVGNGFICPECREKFDNWKTMSIHLWRIHVVDMELYTCDICNYKTYSYGKLINMHRRIHSEDRPFLCDTCGKGFKTSKQLRNHRVIHLDKRKHRNLRSGECDICHRRFSDRRMLRVHNDTVHSKLRPYLCSYCGYAASCRSTLKMHIRQHTGEKPFACEKCEYRTADHNSLRRHKMRHSGEKPYRCPFCPYACIQSSTYKTHLKNKHPGMDEGLMFCCPHCSFRTIKKENFITHMVDHKMMSGNKWTMDGGSETSGAIPETISSSSTDVKLEDGCNSFLSGSMEQQEAVPDNLQSHMESIPQYVYSVQENITHGVINQVITMDSDNPEERFPILASQLKLSHGGHLAEVDDANSVQIHSADTVQIHASSRLEMECGDDDRINLHVVEETMSGNVRDGVHISDSNLQDDQLPSETDVHNTLGHVQLVTLNPLSPTSILPDSV